MTVLMILVGVAAASVLFVVGVADVLYVRNRRREMVLEVVDQGGGTWLDRVEAWDRSYARTRAGKWVAAQLVLAGDERSPVLVSGVAAAGGLVFGWLLAVLLAPVFGLLGVAAMVIGLRTWLGRARERRNEQFIAQMPELARVLSNATSAGLSIAAAVGVAGGELNDPAGSELKRVANRMRFGASLETAMGELSERLPSREASVLTSTLLVSSRSGGSLVTALRDIADTLEQRKETRREVRTILAQATATGYTVVGMGAGILVLLNFLQEGTVAKMTQDWLGRAALVVGCGLLVGGALLIRRMTRFPS
ncbi:type II secretion system F family protein [Cellulomonas xiejunii]|uniref:Type II secretion system F family protein n=1 Tax=Cellulomonas xiejunii TaxID=2968083 RepID=A0ABY5KK42_9CELL|nr:type II secretion system F family protein [Cellulomonas xiejunii]MCC2312727.1 type II secretion system F family protein [Cellulomonas xiejunii]MCC2320403.1 type II secretion system F family protein [Cellulomonas xiejunii]UUI70700.1 type II secretion system F family protein [Cellulomonas xiejunii]